MRRASLQVLGVIAATAVLAGALLAWALATPGYRGPDEPQHVSTALRLATGGGYPDPVSTRIDDGVRGSYEWLGFPSASTIFDNGEPVGPNEAESLPSTGELRAAGGPYPDEGLLDQMTQHPPGYSAYLATWVQVFGLDDAPVNTLLLVLRLASALLLLPIPWLIAATVRTLGMSPTAQVVGAFLPAAWIQFVHIGGVVNNGTLLALAASVYVWLLVRVLGGDLRVVTALGVGAALAVALLTKGFALALVPLGPFAYVVAARRHGRGAWIGMAVAAVTATVGLAWWIRNLVVFGTLQPTGSSGSPAPAVEADALLEWAPRFLRALSGSMWMNLGWLETPIVPGALHLAASLLVLAGLVLGSWRLRRGVAELVVLHCAWLLPVCVFALGSARSYLVSGSVVAAQGRYLHMAVLALAVLLAAALARPRWFALAAPAVAVVSVVAGLAYGLRHFWDPATPATVASWWPGGAAMLVASAALLLTGLALGLLAGARIVRAPQLELVAPAPARH
ncbi:hypothetical protein ARHIZOSPH14_33630 [Agromyces rhizosphaerae]|uniref:DUF2142 domain-containing protein n=1 Tax=Agromyces rhizosphaerae TaxID=88374 RepID=A0A9W6D041_9MICO|nr:DUF2142 domain-containing protein [Agromyces rhizosphaerae]GLI29121.1 hypothetical protein ARHIZOSPH14_33630 [Agromyces rhizosphaerae]